MGQILCIATYREMALRARQIAARLALDVVVRQGVLDDADAIVAQLGADNIDVCISRGGTADYVRQRYACPVVSMDASIYDLLACAKQAARPNTRLAVTSHGKPYLGLEFLERLFGVKATGVVFQNRADLARKLEALSLEGAFHVIGGCASVQLARSFGLEATLLETTEATIEDAFSRAAEAAAIRREEMRRASRLRTILESIYDGVVAVDPRGTVELCNPAARRMLRLDEADPIGAPVERVIPGTKLTQVLRTGVPETGRLQSVGAARIVTNRVPIRDRAEIVGAVATFQEAREVVQAERRVRQEEAGKGRFEAKFTFGDILGRSEALLEKKRLAARYAASDLTVLLYGRSGTGKELFAQSIHSASARRSGPFVAVNCGALPASLIESELFGYEEGAFTGAKRNGKAGLFELAHKGTLFLDEVDGLPPALQCRLLRVLQEREVLRIGGAGVIPVDVRVIAATNRPPQALLAEKRLREDLYYRLNVLYLRLPPLRERSEDIETLVRHFLRREGVALAQETLEVLLRAFAACDWPGNVRQLQNAVQRLAFLWPDCQGDARKLLRELLPGQDAAERPPSAAPALQDSLREAERHSIRSALRAHRGSRAAAARALGVSRSTLWRKMRDLGLAPQTDERTQTEEERS